MNYLDIYFSRINHLGENTAERIRNSGMRSFEKWLNESPFTVRNLSVERGLYFDGIIQENKDKEYKKIMFLEVANDIPLLIGDIMNWKLENGVVEKWLILQEEKKTNQIHKTFWIIRCNYLLKWVDKDGHIQQSWSYCTSSLDSKIKGNYRTWHNLISPQPNKFLEILMPKITIARSTNFIIEEELWTVIEYDHTSVPGTIYISLTEGKINLLTDDLKNNLADTDKIAVYDLSIPSISQTFNLGDHITPVFTLTKNGSPSEEEVILSTSDKKIVRLINNELIAVGYGTVDIIATLKNHPEITKTISIVVNENTEPEFSGYIEGKDKIRLNRTETYALKGTKEIEGKIEYSLEETELASIIDLTDNECIIKANDKNQLGTIILIASYNDVDYRKEIKIIPLW